ncbi:MAG: NAD-dependent epimerase/dehydratase family protein [Planctomycetota bacterium]|jgi:nucleoside-diphosphate-sugar epimerase
MSKYLITGGAGFLGLNLVYHLLGQGEKVVVYDNFSTGKKKWTREFTKDVKLVEGDILDLKELKKAARSCDYVVHLAGQCSVLKSVKDPATSLQINAMGTLEALIAARDAKVKRFIYVGSAAAYGESPSLPKVESMNDTPLSPYAVSTIAAENQCRVFFNTYGLQTVILLAFNVFGPYQDTSGPYAPVVSKFIQNLIDSKQPVVCGDGKQSRDFVHVDDLLEAIKSACIAPKAEGALQHRHRQPHHRQRPGQPDQRHPRQGDPAEVRGSAPRRHPPLARGHHQGAGNARLPPPRIDHGRPVHDDRVVPEEQVGWTSDVRRLTSDGAWIALLAVGASLHALRGIDW